MAGSKDKRGFIDKDRLDLSERQAVEYWMKRWGVTRDQLTAAHRKAGRMVKDIAAELGRRVAEVGIDAGARYSRRSSFSVSRVPHHCALKSRRMAAGS
jgi:hypothetical protein